MKLNTTDLLALLAKADFNANNIGIADYVITESSLTIFFESKLAPVDSLDECTMLVLSVEDADTLIEKHYDDGLNYGYEYLLNIQHDSNKQGEVDAILGFIKGYVFMAARTADISVKLDAEVRRVA